MAALLAACDGAKPRAEPAPVVTAKRENPSAPPAYEAAIARGLSYLDASRAHVSSLQWLFVDYLQRKFGLDPRFAAVNTLRAPPTTGTEALHFRVHERIAFPDQLVDRLPLAEADPMSRVVMAAAHCDHIPVFAEFAAELEQMIARSDYDLTHAALALQLTAENGCAVLPAARVVAVRAELAQGMAKLAADPKTSWDLRYEALALLFYTGHAETVRSEWLDRIVSEQQADGGWLGDRAAPLSNDHSSVLAIWALLEAARPQAPRLPLLRRPSAAQGHGATNVQPRL
ncbi:MAG TPA: hypothetical protein VHM19_21410 [Polyangiales bacterium]|nr:hypothetical protein [Polyangiales bacterium]